jgi:uncharacterized flavoprotein (TIGR03862 family)
MAAEVLSAAGVAVTVFERMASVARKFLIAGRGGLNLTHSEGFEHFLNRYRKAAPWLSPHLNAFPPGALIAWAQGLGQATFVGSSGRVFPEAMKASPLLRAWLRRLAAQGVTIRTGHEWIGWNAQGDLSIRARDGAISSVRSDATILALGGASWPRLGSDGNWAELLRAKGAGVNSFRPSNSGFDIAWSENFRQRFAGQPLKGAAFSFGDERVRGEAMIADYGIEGGAIYALSAPLRDAVDRDGAAILTIDLKPTHNHTQIVGLLGSARAGQSTANLLRKAAGLSPLAINLMREAHGISLPSDPGILARLIKDLPLRLIATQPIARAISSAGGIELSSLDEHLMLCALPGVFAAGEMLDWESPTGGYLLQACFSTGVAAAKGALRYLGAAQIGP